MDIHKETQYLSALVREGFDDPFHIHYYLDKTAAINMISFAIRTNCVAGVYVYRIDHETPANKLKLAQRIELLADHDNKTWKIWTKQKEKQYSSSYIMQNPEVMYDCLEYIDTNLRD